MLCLLFSLIIFGLPLFLIGLASLLVGERTLSDSGSLLYEYLIQNKYLKMYFWKWTCKFNLEGIMIADSIIYVERY